MADNTVQNATDTIATDDLATVNGGAVSGVKVQRVKAGFGVDSDLKDVAPLVGLPVAPQQAATGTASTPALNTTSGTVLAANTARKGVLFYNNTNVDALVSISASATTATTFSLRIAVGGYYELPLGSVYTGNITAIGVAAGTLTPTASSGPFCVTELT